MPQRASTLDKSRFDKTGRWTEGKPQVVAVKPLTALRKLRHYVWQPRSNKAAQPPAGPCDSAGKAGDDKPPQVNGFRTLRGLGVSVVKAEASSTASGGTVRC